jgi:hypothetical protein
MSTPEEHLSASLKFQEYYDTTLRKIGLRAPQPTLGQTVNDYRRETLRTIKRTFLPQNHQAWGGAGRVSLETFLRFRQGWGDWNSRSKWGDWRSSQYLQPPRVQIARDGYLSAERKMTVISRCLFASRATAFFSSSAASLRTMAATWASAPMVPMAIVDARHASIWPQGVSITQNPL